ncbi:MAG TPA: EthD domain-containing protein [Oligoflexia bacterium]|nr:EthD domain-containing protein [Oligoflexia bacterium]HMR25535.1 EthD domain-containing protein [Oligoflexia bacterium]
MFTILVVVRKKENISTEEFRRVWKEEYGPFYAKMPEVKSYKQYHLTDRRKDETEDPIDGVAMLSFDSEEAMKKAFSTELYKEAAKIRESIMRETAVGVHVTSIDEIVAIV